MLRCFLFYIAAEIILTRIDVICYNTINNIVSVCIFCAKQQNIGVVG